MNNTIRIILVWLLSICYLPIFSQSFTFHHLETTDGLSQVTINSIFQDEFGRMWFGTRDGLNCYDGNSIKVFRPVPGDTTSLPKAWIGNVLGDQQGHLYLHAESSFVILDLKKEVFKTIAEENVYCISQGKNGIWVYLKNSLMLYDLKDNIFKHICTLGNSFRVYSIDEDSQNTCWISTSTGLFSLDKNMTLTKHFPGKIIRKVLEDHNKNIWILSFEGLIKYTPSSIKYFKHDEKNHNSIVHDYIRVACEDEMGYIWLGSQYGLSRFNPITEEFDSFTSSEGNTLGLSSKSITSLFKDRQGTVWIGTYFGGVNYLNTENQPFRIFFPKGNEFSDQVIGKFTEDRRGTIWICLEGGGLCSYEPKTKKFTSYPEKISGIPEKNLKEIWYDPTKECLWLGTHTHKLYKYDIFNQKITTYGKELNEMFKNSNSILPFGNDLLIGTSMGICVLNPSDGKISYFLEGEEKMKKAVRSMIIDSQNRLWAGTNSGLVCYNLNTQSFTAFEYIKNSNSSLSSNSVSIVFEDSKQRIWVGTSGFGLNLYCPKTNTFKVFTKEKNQLSDNNIVAIKEAKSGNILIGTNRGLSICNISDTTFTNYTYQNGFPLKTINEGSLFVDKRGMIYAGGIEGMTIFSEADLLPTPPSPFNISFTRLYVNNFEVVQEDKTNILSVSLPYTNEIVLRPGYSVFSINFMTDNYVHSDPEEVEYRLKGYETYWMKARIGKMLTYTNLNPGTYQLEIRGVNFPDKIKSLSIIIKPPFYFSWQAYLIYSILIICIIVWLGNQAKTRLLLTTSLEYEKKEKKQTEELTQAKLRFFTNISHEIRIPVTLILGQTETLMHTHNIPPSAYSKILNIYKNASNLKALISELLDFRKQEQGHLKLKVSYLNLITFLEEIFLTFNDYAKEKGIEFQFIHEQTEIFIWFDPEQIQKVVNNLLSNAFKYTEKGGKIILSVKDFRNNVEFSITDTGHGIQPEELKKVFDRFYQSNAEENNLGTGIGLALSKGIIEAHHGEILATSNYKEGSTFTVLLKKGDVHFGENVIRTDAVKEISFYENELPDEKFIREIIEITDNNGEKKPILLIVEDNEELRKMLSEMFNPFYQVHEATDGRKGWEKLNKINPDIVISDIMMPKMSGIELCSKIKNSPETCHIPVILLTAKTAVEHKFEGLKTGADDYITKPFNLKLLIIRCNNLVNNRKVLRRKFVRNPNLNIPQITTNSSDSDLLNKATEIVLRNIQNETFDVEFFAKELGLGRTSLFNKLKGITGLSPNQFVINIRLKKAAEMLLNNPDMNISEVAYATGFNSPHYFNRCFKEQFGSAPLTYRQKHLK